MFQPLATSPIPGQSSIPCQELAGWDPYIPPLISKRKPTDPPEGLKSASPRSWCYNVVKTSIVVIVEETLNGYIYICVYIYR
jgi:hypothetical protein